MRDDLARGRGTEPRPETPTPPEPVGPAPAEVQPVTEDERLLLATLTDQPKGMVEVVGRMRPEDFAVPSHGQPHHCLGALHHRGEPLDRMTLL
ncbi:hypothetical protein NMG29_18630 [Streptomyces cocklensis]|uniref:DNA helicase DnaB-like N-terminal domain-containing protein n=1 Tax=Actinacidiphila cocklensis TaxID=887465 RepID=A0A9W4DKD1_9ACTN|nr:DnaB-like helicase N-terminal domain-containing protein [Actinacidiphila cocklensis]MDD1060190.1 hypothetical protein [Actinacidiphila cocklensis]WSX76622.1 hypothetical protein OH826_24005 [Streptomyces sp. NBC_00899]CAG6391779.1 hypothetical protein SCOCK_130183 [Actinacidiphila cocklensis]